MDIDAVSDVMQTPEHVTVSHMTDNADPVDEMTSMIQSDVEVGGGGDDGDLTSAAAMSVMMDSADIIPEAAMKCGILPVGPIDDRYRDDIDSLTVADSLIDGIDDADMTSSVQQLPLQSSADQPQMPSSPCAALKGALPSQTDDVIPTSSPAVPVSSTPVSSVQQAASDPAPDVELCAGCRRPITDRYLLRAVDRNWHEDCLRCSCCDCRLGEVGSTLFTRSNLLLCRRDYLRLYGTTGYCAACSKLIPAFEMIMRAKDNVYHLDCFACQRCNHRFCIGDKFYLSDNKILCEFDHQEDERAKLYASGAAAATVSPSTSVQSLPYSSSSTLSQSPSSGLVVVENGSLTPRVQQPTVALSRHGGAGGGNTGPPAAGLTTPMVFDSTGGGSQMMVRIGGGMIVNGAAAAAAMQMAQLKQRQMQEHQQHQQLRMQQHQVHVQQQMIQQHQQQVLHHHHQQQQQHQQLAAAAAAAGVAANGSPIPNGNTALECSTW